MTTGRVQSEACALEVADVVVIGSGPAGLAAATAIRRSHPGRVLVVERQARAGGIPAQCDHRGFGLRDLHRSYSGPDYSRALAGQALEAGVEIITETTAFIESDGALAITGPAGLRHVEAAHVLLATGARERPRTARLVPGTRPAGVFTTGQLQQFVRRSLPVGSRALVVGAEHVSFSAVLTLREAGVAVRAMVTDLEEAQSLPVANAVLRHLYRVPLMTRTAVVSLEGRRRLQGVTLEDCVTGARLSVEVDTIVFSGGWVPEYGLARSAGVVLDPGSGGPAVDALGRTSRIGWFAAGNLVHPVETADSTAVQAARVGAGMAASLTRTRGPLAPAVPVRVAAPLAWVWPNLVRPGLTSGGDVTLLRTAEFGAQRSVRFSQDGRELGTYRIRHLTPNRSLRVGAAWRNGVSAEGGLVTASLH